MRRALLLAAALSAAAAASAQAPPPASAPEPGMSSAQAPSALADVSIEQRLGAALPLDLPFRDEAGRTVRLGDYFRRRPVLLAFVYYECPMLCSYVESGTLKAMRAMSFTAGRDFDLVTISIDPADLPTIAASKKSDFLQQYGRGGADRGVHFLTGSEDSIAAVTRAAGFRFVWDPETKSFSHAAGLMLATPDGVLSRYFYGIEYSARDIKLGVMDASGGKIGSPVDRVLLYCSHYDPTTGKYGLVVMRVVRLGGLLTVASLGLFMTVMIRRDRRRKKS
ncbi:MAG TPA: SCO family protein [Thermoanaerobaculia bacterium]|nr:SCO family protein [Thermoanaerobaculia bacterium]